MAVKTATTLDRLPAALLELWGNVAALAGVPMYDGVPPAGVFGGPEWIAVTDAEGTQEVRAMDVTNRPRFEDYEQEVLVSVVREARSVGSAAVVARAMALFVLVADAIRDDPTLSTTFTGDGQIQSVEVSRFNLLKRQTDTERTAEVVITLRVRARV